MLMWFLWTVVAGLLLSGAHVVATCLPAGWLTPNQGLQSPSDLVIHAQQLQQDLWPQCQSMLDSDAQAATMPHADQQNLAMCQELDSILTDLQSSWHALHHHSQACSVLGVIPGLPACSSPDTPQNIPISSRPPDTNPPAKPTSPQQQQQKQLETQHQSFQAGTVLGDGTSSSINRSPPAEGQHVSKAVHARTRSAQALHSQHALFPGPIFTPSIDQQQQQQQQQHQTGHGWAAHQQPLGLLQQQAGQPNERLVLSQESTQGTAHRHQLWGGVLLSAQQLWDNLIYDTQVVQKQLESEAQIGGQACRSCLVPHLHKSHREVVSEVVALLILGAFCASGLFLVATCYRRRQSTRRQTQQSIATQRLRHFEKLQQQRRQEEEVRRSVEESREGVGLPWLQRPQPAAAVAVKHTRHRGKTSEPTIPSSPSASSSHSEAIGTQVRPHSNSKPGKAGEPKRARSSQRSVVNLGPVDSLHHGLGRSRSDLSTEAAQHGPFEMPQQSMHSMQGAEASMQEFPPGSAPSTPSSMAGSTSFNPFHQPPSTHQAPSPPSYDSSKATSAASVDGSVDSVHAKQAGSKRRNRHKGKSRAAKKMNAPPAKRRFIPGLDSEFDPAIHELPTPPQDPATDRQQGAEQSLGCSGPTSYSSALPELQARQQLSVDAPIFVPTGYANMGSFCRSPSHFPSTQLPDWQPHFGSHHYEGQGCPVPYQLPQEGAETGSLLAEPALAPHLSQAPLPFNNHLEMVPPLGRPWDYDDHGVYTLPSLPKPSPRNSPTSVLPACLPLASEIGSPVFGSSVSGSGCASFPFSTAGEHQPQLGLVGSSGGWGLPPLLEESMGSPFPGMPSRTSERPNHTTAGVSALAGSIFSDPASVGISVPEQPQLSSLPGFNSIWRTAKSTGMHNAEDTWQSFTADKSNSIW